MRRKVCFFRGKLKEPIQENLNKLTPFTVIMRVSLFMSAPESIHTYLSLPTWLVKNENHLIHRITEKEQLYEDTFKICFLYILKTLFIEF